ncbi:MAG: PIN domain-containing protein [Clostridiales bacterium]|jgi:predicted nucleic acid-binding protein|nr:PIN domain-containing protein [Clostridiales bacterium]
MKVLIDTNVILDVLLARQPHFEFSLKCAKICGEQIIGCLTATQTKDIFYILEKNKTPVEKAKHMIKELSEEFVVLDVLAVDVQSALISDISDYEDALIAHCAARSGMDYIITRNAKDFDTSPIRAISPKDFLEMSRH